MSVSEDYAMPRAMLIWMSGAASWYQWAVAYGHVWVCGPMEAIFWGVFHGFSCY